MAGAPTPLPTPTKVVDQSLAGKSVERHQEFGGQLPANVTLGNAAPAGVHGRIQSLQGDNQVGYDQSLGSEARVEKRVTPPPTPAPSANLDDHPETHSNRNRGVMTHDLSAALSKSQAAPGGPTGEAREARHTTGTGEKLSGAGKVDTATQGISGHAAGVEENGQSALSAAIAKSQHALEEFTHLAQGAGEGVAEKIKEYYGLGKEKMGNVDVSAAAAQTSETAQGLGAAAAEKAQGLGAAATEQAQGLTAVAADNLKSSYRAVQDKIQQAEIPQKLRDYEEHYKHVAMDKAHDVKDRTVEAAQYIAARTKEVRAEDINNSLPARIAFGVFLLWLMTGIPLKWLLLVIAMLAGGAYLYGQVTRRRSVATGAPPPQIPRTGQMEVVPAGEFGDFRADTGALHAAEEAVHPHGQHASTPQAGGIGPMVETHYPRGRQAAEGVLPGPPTPLHTPDQVGEQRVKEKEVFFAAQEE